MKRLVLVLTATTLLAACHGGATPDTMTPPSPKASYDLAALGQRYLAIVRTNNQAIDRARKMPTDTLAEQKAFFLAVSKAFTNAEEQVAGLELPPSMLADQHAVIAALSALAEDARQGAEATTPSAMQQVQVQVQQDETTEASASAVLRADLGLPPPS